MKKREPSSTVDGNINWYSLSGEQYGGSLKKLKTKLAILLLGMYMEKMKTIRIIFNFITTMSYRNYLFHFILGKTTFQESR